MRDDFRLQSSSTLLRGYAFDIERRTISHAGATFERDVALPRGSVAILCRDEFGRVSTIHQYRAALNDWSWEIPAGRLDVDGESPREAAERELREEIGVIANSWKLLGTFSVSPGWTDQRMHVFSASDIRDVGRHTMGPEENSSEVFWMSPDELRSLQRRGEPLDATLVLAMNSVFGTYFD